MPVHSTDVVFMSARLIQTPHHLLDSSPGASAWRTGDSWRVLSAPIERIVVADVDRSALLALPNRVTALLEKHPGAVARGLISYEAGRLLHGDSCGRPPRVPAAVVHVYAADPEAFHHGGSASPGANRPGSPDSGNSRRDRRSHRGADGFGLTEEFKADIAKADYLAALKKIQAYLAAGDCYQINFAQRFSALCKGDSRSAWLALLAAHPAPHACYMDWGDGQVFGVSPERFIRVRGRQIQSEPIKGSVPRSADAMENEAHARRLLASEKDRAENLMIVDLLRNDLGQVCLPGSITAQPLFQLRRFSNVQHLVSTVSGELRAGVSPLGALLACFPGGSITGAPKKRAMEIIAELEPEARGFYCGCFFELDGEGNLDSNILIRTLQRQGEILHCHGGGGITHDSDPEQEYQESLFKVEKLMASVAGV